MSETAFKRRNAWLWRFKQRFKLRNASGFGVFDIYAPGRVLDFAQEAGLQHVAALRAQARREQPDVRALRAHRAQGHGVRGADHQADLPRSAEREFQCPAQPSIREDVPTTLLSTLAPTKVAH